MKSKYHLFVSGVLALFWADRPFLAISCLLSGVLMDIDHLVDFYIFTNRITFNIDEMLETIKGKPQFFCPLHGLDSVLFLSLLLGFNEFSLGLIMGMTTHIFFDVLTNDFPLKNMFLIYRHINGYQR